MAKSDQTEDKDTQIETSAATEAETDGTGSNAAPRDVANKTGDATEAKEADPEAKADGPDLDKALAASTLIAAEATADEHPEAKPSPEPHDDLHEDHHDEEEHHGWSLAGRALTGLILLLVGGGLTLWAAPKVAPHLPSGLGPVKTWLLPGESLSQRELAALRTDLEARIDGIDTTLDEGRVGEIAGGAISDLRTEVEAELQALRDQVAAADSGDIESRLAQLETRAEGLAAQVDSLTALNIEGLNEEQTAALSGFAAAVEGLRGEISALADHQGVLTQRIDEVEVTARRRVEEAEAEVAAVTEEAAKSQSATIIRASLQTIEAALGSGDPYEKPLAALAAEVSGDMPEALTATAATGVSTLGALRTGFGDAAHAAIKADIRAGEGEGVASRVAAFLESQVASRSLSPQEGPGTDAVLSRAEEALRHDNLASAVEELSDLPAPAREAMAGWISRAEARVATLKAFAELQTSLTAQN